MQPQHDETAVEHGRPHPFRARVLVTTEGLESKPAIYIPEGAVTRHGVERGIVLEVGDTEENVPFKAGDVVRYHPGHVTEMGPDLKLINLDCIVAWEDA